MRGDGIPATNVLITRGKLGSIAARPPHRPAVATWGHWRQRLAVNLSVFDHPSFDLHLAGRDHVENPRRIAAARAGIAESGLKLRHVAAPLVTRDEIVRAHTEAHADAIMALDETWQDHDEDTHSGPGTREATLRAAGAASLLGRSLMEGDGRGFALVRPPGHHAESMRAMGFCLLNNVAIAARSAQKAGAKKVAIIDWDVHHGNGTQEIFEHDADVLFISLHQWPLYPGTGAPGEVGLGVGAGRTVNVAMPPGAHTGEYVTAFNTLILPILEAHQPDALLVSAGFDAHREDPLGEINLDEHAYAWMSHEMHALATRLGAPLGFLLEGGYNIDALRRSVRASVTGLVEAPPSPASSCSPEALKRLALTRAALAPYWELPAI